MRHILQTESAELIVKHSILGRIDFGLVHRELS
jgi:hypothetical protein